MSNTIIHKNSSTQSAVPTTADLAFGEIGVNTYDGKMFLKKDDGTVAIKEIGGPTRETKSIFWGPQTISEDTTIPSNVNAMSVGPEIEVGTSVTITVSDGAIWSVV